MAFDSFVYMWLNCCLCLVCLGYFLLWFDVLFVCMYAVLGWVCVYCCVFNLCGLVVLVYRLYCFVGLLFVDLCSTFTCLVVLLFYGCCLGMVGY